MLFEDFASQLHLHPLAMTFNPTVQFVAAKSLLYAAEHACELLVALNRWIDSRTLSIGRQSSSRRLRGWQNNKPTRGGTGITQPITTIIAHDTWLVQ
jgi:hypothetical protein